MDESGLKQLGGMWRWPWWAKNLLTMPGVMVATFLGSWQWGSHSPPVAIGESVLAGVIWLVAGFISHGLSRGYFLSRARR